MVVIKPFLCVRFSFYASANNRRRRHHVFGSSVRPSVRCLSLVFAWLDSSVLSERISMKLATNVHRALLKRFPRSEVKCRDHVCKMYNSYSYSLEGAISSHLWMLQWRRHTFRRCNVEVHHFWACVCIVCVYRLCLKRTYIYLFVHSLAPYSRTCKLVPC